MKISLVIVSRAYTSVEGRLWLRETPQARTCKVIGAAELMSELNLVRKDFQKMSISCFLIVTKDKSRSIGGSEFQRRGSVLK